MKDLTISITTALVLATGVFTGCGGGGSSTDKSSQLQTIAQALLGPLSEADYKITTPIGYVLAEGKTTKGDGVDVDTAGLIQVTQATVDTLKGTPIFVIEVIGGKDIDANDDKIWDENPIDVNRSIHVIVDNAVPEESDVFGDTGKIKITVLSEIIFQDIKDSINQYTPIQLKDELKKRAEKLFKNDLNKDGVIDNKDTMEYSPATYKDMLKDDTKKVADEVLGDIHAGIDFSYATNLFTPKLKEHIHGNHKETYTYDNHGNIKTLNEEFESNSGIIKSTTIYTYNDKDQLISQSKNYTQGGNNSQFIDATTTYEYDLNGNLITEEIDYQQDSSVDFKTTYEYNNQGQITKKSEYYDDDETADVVTTYEYEPDDGTLIEETRDYVTLQGEFDIDLRREWEYNENGQITKKREDYRNDNTIDTTTTYTYNLDGKLIKESIDVNGDSIEDNYIVYRYDQNNNLFQKQWLRNYFNTIGDSTNQVYITEQSEYEYDKYQNKIKKSSIIFPTDTLFHNNEIINPIYTDIEIYIWR